MARVPATRQRQQDQQRSATPGRDESRIKAGQGHRRHPYNCCIRWWESPRQRSIIPVSTGRCPSAGARIEFKANPLRRCCPGMLSFQTTRREFLRLGVAGLGLPALSALRDGGQTASSSTRTRLRPGQERADRLHRGRPEPTRDVGPQARSSRDRPRRIRGHPHSGPRHSAGRTHPPSCRSRRSVHDPQIDVARGSRPRHGDLPGADRALPQDPLGESATEPRRQADLRIAADPRPTHREFAHTAVHLNAPLFSPTGTRSRTVRRAARSRLRTTAGRGHRRPQCRDARAGQPARPAAECGSQPDRNCSPPSTRTATGSRPTPCSPVETRSTNRPGGMLANPACRQAFDLSREPTALRDRYGRNRSGQTCLLARRLVEAGVPLITVMWNHNARDRTWPPTRPMNTGGILTTTSSWRCERHLLAPIRSQLLGVARRPRGSRPARDHAGGLHGGIRSRSAGGTENAASPAARPGRKHWAAAYSIVLAGAGVRPGAVYGATDRLAAFPRTEPVTPWDIGATIFHALGIDPHTSFHRFTRPALPIDRRPRRDRPLQLASPCEPCSWNSPPATVVLVVLDANRPGTTTGAVRRDGSPYRSRYLRKRAVQPLLAILRRGSKLQGRLDRLVTTLHPQTPWPTLSSFWTRASRLDPLTCLGPVTHRRPSRDSLPGHHPLALSDPDQELGTDRRTCRPATIVAEAGHPHRVSPGRLGPAGYGGQRTTDSDRPGWHGSGSPATTSELFEQLADDLRRVRLPVPASIRSPNTLGSIGSSRPPSGFLAVDGQQACHRSPGNEAVQPTGRPSIHAGSARSGRHPPPRATPATTTRRRPSPD